ncbi:restriction endonuclease subunit S [Cronobacter malonaticus]|uniref:restriction endonuclease subunit S n=1 Tax=Cronobacter malonaticus TaxID=413503 RepID=UPI0013758509|nr:restriction endonuclease subunit S [Cronobacter malonaticus]NCH84423.1 restriction endonuclease subunit S [Cronobacter malonaticus]
MAKYKAYPEYKDSGVEWLGLVPKSWTVCRLKNLATIKNGQDYKSVQTDDGYPVMGSGGQFTFASKFMYDKPSVLLGRKGTIDKPLYINEPFWTVDTMYYTELNEGFDAKYVHYLALTIQFSRYSTNTALPSMTQEHLSNYKFSVPKAESERKKITEFLDLETAKIDNLIEKQQQLIELLKEKRQAVISHAVTKGLNPDVPMKDSGVEWLGEIPEHWLCTKIKYIALLTPKKSSVNFKNNDECTFIPMEKLKRNSLVTDESKLIRDVISGYTYFEDDDLLLAKVTPCFENKNIAVARGLVNNIGFGSTEIYVLRPTEKIRVDYLLYRLQEDNFIRAATGAMTGAGGLKRVPSDFLLNYPIAIPPKPEMDAIVAYLNAQEVHYDLMEKNATQAVQLLQERRTALISAAVTGKIDVRDWVAPDTQDVEVPEEVTA